MGIVFSFDKEQPSMFAAVKAMPVLSPDHACDPMVWTPQLANITTRRVWVVCSKTSRGRDTFRIYPLQKRSDAPHPAFVIVPAGSPWVTDPTVHVVFTHRDFVIIRPLLAVYYKAKTAIRKGDLAYIPSNLLTLVKHCYFQELVDDAFIDEITKKFEKLDKIIARTSSNFEHEVRVCQVMALRLCTDILTTINTKVNIE